MEELAQQLEKTAFPGAFSWYDMMVLIPEVQKLKSGETYVEVGVDKGRSLSVAKEVAEDGVKLWGVDLQKDPKVPGTNFIQGDSYFSGVGWKHGKISLLHIDGDHSYIGCKRDIDAWSPHVKKGGVMVFHDCDETSPGVVRAVFELVDSGRTKGISLFKNRWNTSMARIQL